MNNWQQTKKPRQPENSEPKRWELVEREQKVRDVVIRIARRLASEKK